MALSIATFKAVSSARSSDEYNDRMSIPYCYPTDRRLDKSLMNNSDRVGLGQKNIQRCTIMNKPYK